MTRDDKSNQLLQRKPASGFTLVEVMVTVLVVSLGLLGLAALQINSLRNGQDAYQYTLATQLAYDAADRVRANLTGAKAGKYNAVDTTTSAPAEGCTDTAPACTSAKMAQQDWQEWIALFDTSGGKRPVLPNGEMQITLAGSTFTITVAWDSTPKKSVTTEFNL